MRMETNEPVGSATKPFKCTTCPKSYLHESSLKEHVLTKHVKDESESCYTCEKCPGNNELAKSFATKRSLIAHMSRVHGPRRFTCRVCFKTFKASSEFRRHERIHLPNDAQTNSCEYCSKTFTEKYSLQRHLFSAHKRKTAGCNYLKCDLCSLEFMSRSRLESHVASNHVVDKAFECPVCSKHVSDQYTLNAHMKGHDRRTRYFCDVCSKGFKHKRNFIPHLEMAHNKLFYCYKCSRSFTHKSQFDTHSLPKSSFELKLDLNCQICSEGFYSRCDLDFHTNCHLEVIKSKGNKRDTDPDRNLKFQCELCSKSFDRESYFRAHRHLEHPNAEWTCSFPQCSKTFKYYNIFILHKLKHEGTRPFVCSICQKSFYESKKLREHEKSHLPQTKYKCNKCPKSLLTPSKLRHHVANEHGGPNPFQCPIKSCETRWATNGALKDHLASHMVNNSFRCDMCSPYKAYTALKNLKRHQRVAHYNEHTSAEDNSRNSKFAGAVKFSCSSKNCNFQTVHEIDIAAHHNQQHQLPRVLLFHNIT